MPIGWLVFLVTMLFIIIFASACVAIKLGKKIEEINKAIELLDKEIDTINNKLEKKR